MYFLRISVPTIISNSNAQNDLSFSAILPVRKRDIVKSKFISFITLEMLPIFFAIIFAIISVKLWWKSNFMLDLTMAFICISILMFALFIAIFLPMYFKTGYKFGFPLVLATITTLLFVGVANALVLIYPDIALALEGTSSEMVTLQFVFLISSVLIAAVSTVFSYKVSSARFEKVDL